VITFHQNSKNIRKHTRNVPGSDRTARLTSRRWRQGRCSPFCNLFSCDVN